MDSHKRETQQVHSQSCGKTEGQHADPVQLCEQARHTAFWDDEELIKRNAFRLWQDGNGSKGTDTKNS